MNLNGKVAIVTGAAGGIGQVQLAQNPVWPGGKPAR